MANITLPGHVTIQHQVGLPQLQRTHQVLNVTELLEGIISFLPPDPLLRAPQICRAFAQTIATSPRLRRAVRAAIRLHTRRLSRASLPPPMRGICMSHTRAHGQPGVQLAIDFRRHRRNYFALRGSRPLHGMLVASPPPTTATVRIDCACELQKQKQKQKRVACERGVRFSDVFGAVDHVLRGRSMCGSCGGYYYVRVEGRLAVATMSYVRTLKAFKQ